MDERLHQLLSSNEERSMKNKFETLNEAPNYSIVEAAHYLRLRQQEIRRWIDSEVVCASGKGLSFFNLLELHTLKGLRKGTGLPMQRIRRALMEFNAMEKSAHPLLDPRLETDGLHLFLHDGDAYFNLNRAGQMGLSEILRTYLKRIDRFESGEMIFFPFIASEDADEPRTIQMAPQIAFGRPVLANTGIAVDIIAGRFRARDTVSDLAEEYGVPARLIEEAIRLEFPILNAA
jgi:uncharacterized protein (DUF433 family)